MPAVIQNSLNVFKNFKFNNRFGAVIELTAQCGDAVSLEMNTNGYIENIKTDVNKIESVHGKEFN